MSKKWGAVIRGEQFDLDDWINALKVPFDPWVEVHGPDTVLRSQSFDGLSSADEVRDRAVTHVERLNGAMAISNNSQPLQFGGVVEFSPDGCLHRTVFLEAGAYGVGRASAIGVALGPDGTPKAPPPPTPSEVQNWASLADADDLLEDALIYFGRATAPRKRDDPTHWFDIYKTLECLILKFGPGEAAFLARNWAPASDVERLKRTANWARHARRKFNPPPNPMTMEDARDLTARLLRKAFA
jgi:hypothetical protein